MLGISRLVREVKESSAHLASKGFKYRPLLEQLSVPPQVALFIAQKYIEGFGFYFLVGEQNIRVRSMSFEEFLAIYDDLVCRAADTQTDQVCGIVDPGVIGDNESHLKRTLETVAASRTQGCLVADLANIGNGPQVHSVVDKLVGLGYLEKQSINPIAKAQHSRIDTKAVVLHNRRYVSHYDDEADGVKIVYGTSYLDKIHAMIVSILERKNVLTMPAREVAKYLGISRWDMQALRYATIAQDKKEACRVRFFQATGSIVHASGIVGPETVMWFAGIAGENAEGSTSAVGRNAFACFANFPMHETVSSVLDRRDKLCAGLTAADIRALTGASYKRAAKLFAEFHKTFGYPLEKVQDGKQLKYRVLPKPRVEAKGTAASVAPSSEEPIPCEVASEVPVALRFSDQQLLNCGFIEDFLRQRGGVSSFDEIVTAVRVESRRRQREHTATEPSEHPSSEPPSTVVGSTTMDRRTIARTLALLEHSLQRVYTRHFAPDLESPAVALVLLCENAGAEHQLVDDYFARQLGVGEGGTVPDKRSDGSRHGKRRARRQMTDTSSDSDSDSDSEVDYSEGDSEGDSGQDRRRKKVSNRRASTATLASASAAKRRVASSVGDGEGEATGDEAGSAGEIEGDTGWREEGNDSRAPLADDRSVRKRARLRSLQQRKRNDDPALFDIRLELQTAERPGYLDQVSGTLISAVCLHYHLLELSPTSDAVTAGIAGAAALSLAESEQGFSQTGLSFSAASLARHLPFEYYFKTSSAVQRALECAASASAGKELRSVAPPPLQYSLTNMVLLTDPDTLSELNDEVGRALLARRSLGDLLEESSGAPLESVLNHPLRSFMQEHCESELLVVLCLLGAVGVLKPKDPSALDRVAGAVITDLLGRDGSVTSPAQSATSELGLFVTLFRALSRWQDECSADVRRLLLDMSFEVHFLPVGSWQAVRSATDVYHHWRTVVLPSLPVDWTGFHFDLPLPNLALHLLRYWEVERSAELPSETPRAHNRTLFSGGKVKMDLWGSAAVRAAWDCRAVDNSLSLSWSTLLSPSFHSTDPSEATGRAAEPTLFSLDMPRHAATAGGRRKRDRDTRDRDRQCSRGPAAACAADREVPDMSSTTPASTSKRPRGRAGMVPLPAEAGGDDGGGVLGAGEAGIFQDAVSVDGWGNGDDSLLQEELAVLCQDAVADGTDWTLEQVALMVEVVLVRYFCREQRVDQMPGVLRSNEGTGRSRWCISPHLSLLDLKWEDTDFEFVSDGVFAGLIATSGLPDQRLSKHRVMHFLRTYPAALDAVAWVLCCRGRRVSGAFATVTNAMLGPSATTDRTALQQVWTLLMQSYAEGGARVVEKRQLERLRAFPYNLVAHVTREMFVRGMLRQRTDCGSAACKARNDTCPHSKRAFELSERFEEAQREVPWGDYHRALLRRLGEEPLHQACDQLRRCAGIARTAAASTSCRLLAVLQVLSSGPSHLQTSLALSHALPALEEDLCWTEGSCGDSETALIGAAACQKHTGFCESGLNGIAVDLMGAVAAAEPVLTVPQGIATSEPGEDMPWEWREITTEDQTGVTRVNVDLLRLFAEKVLSVLAQKPASDASAIHAAVQVLSLTQTQRLLQEMVGRAWVQQTAAAVTTRLISPFSIGAVRPPPQAPTPAVYFKI